MIVGTLTVQFHPVHHIEFRLDSCPLVKSDIKSFGQENDRHGRRVGERAMVPQLPPSRNVRECCVRAKYRRIWTVTHISITRQLSTQS